MQIRTLPQLIKASLSIMLIACTILFVPVLINSIWIQGFVIVLSCVPAAMIYGGLRREKEKRERVDAQRSGEIPVVLGKDGKVIY